MKRDDHNIIILYIYPHIHVYIKYILYVCRWGISTGGWDPRVTDSGATSGIGGGSTMLWSGDVDMVVFLPSHEWEDLPLRLLTSCFMHDSSWLGISAKVFLA